VFDVDACIVDLDGTLIDTLGDFEVALNRMLAELGLAPVHAEQIRRLVGKGSEHLIRSVLALTAAADAPANDEALYPQAWTLYQRHYLAINGQYSKVFAGVVEGLARFRAAGLRLACLTNKPGAFVLPLLRAKGLDGYFEHCFGGDAFERRKPDPLPLRMSCEALGSAPARTLMVGDSSNDAAAARSAGCPVVLVRYGYNHGQPVDDVDADMLVDRLDQIRFSRNSPGS
jgi:phosphoglycolate phosphatase